MEKKKVKDLIVTMGITGCGKTTWLNKSCGDYPIVETDDIRKKFLNGVDDLSDEKMVFDLTKQHIIELFETSDKVYYGATNADSKYRFDFLSSIKEEVESKGFDLHIMLVIFKCDIEVSRKRIQKDLDNGIDRADSLHLLEEQYKQFRMSERQIKKEKLYKYIHYV